MTDRRKALGLALAASAFALSGRGKARAADALTIDPGGVKIDSLAVAKRLTVDGDTNLGNVSVNGAATLAMNNNHIRLRSAGDHQYGLAYRSKFATTEPDGPVLWGFKGGALATVAGGKSEEDAVKKVALIWSQENVAVYGGLTVTHDATFRKSLTVEGDATLSGPAKITGANTLEFGAGVSGKQGDAGKIGYAVWDKDSLNIVGAGTKAEGRKITFFAEGGATFKGGVRLAKQRDSQPDLAVAGGQEQLRMLRGVVNRDGTNNVGEGFDVKPVAKDRGLYEITFKPPFSSMPGASATQIALGEGSYTSDNALIVTLSADRMRVKTGGRYGDEDPRQFTFIVIGPR